MDEEGHSPKYFHEVSFMDKEGHARITKVPVVQELSRQGLTHLPPRFIVAEPEPNHPQLELCIPQDDQHDFSTPIVNLAKLRTGSDPDRRAEEMAKLVSGVKEWGLFLITDHGVKLDGVRDVVKEFFGLSFEDKKKSVGSYSSTDNIGYGRNFVKSEDQPLDWIDRLSMKAAPKGADGGLHVWPLKPTNFRQVVENYVKEARNVMDELLQVLAHALSLEEDAFLKYLDPDNSEINVRVNFYPPCPMPKRAMGLSAHTDGSVLTLLAQFEATGGLEILKNGRWVSVTWPEDALLVSAGDFLEIMSNGRLKSPWHRVVAQMDVERFSVALFYYPPSQIMIEPVKSDDSLEEIGGYKKVVVSDYLKHFYGVNPSKEKVAIRFAKV